LRGRVRNPNLKSHCFLRRQCFLRMITSFIMRNGRVALPLGEREVSALRNYQVVATAILDVLCQSNHKPSGGRRASSPSDDPSQVDHNNQTDDLLRAIELLE
jgi:hypothetical protein